MNSYFINLVYLIMLCKPQQMQSLLFWEGAPDKPVQCRVLTVQARLA